MKTHIILQRSLDRGDIQDYKESVDSLGYRVKFDDHTMLTVPFDFDQNSEAIQQWIEDINWNLAIRKWHKVKEVWKRRMIKKYGNQVKEFFA